MVAILVAMTFIIAIVIDALVRKRQRSRAEEKVPASAIARPAPSFPLGYFFTPGHLWLNLQSSGKLFVGLDELIQRTIGKINQITLKKKGDKVQKGNVLAVLNKGDKKIHLLSPIDGVIEKTNSELEKSPQKTLERPYKSGWFYVIRPANLVDELKNFTVADKTKAWWSQEMSQLREFVQTRIPQNELAGLTLSDGGVPIDDAVQHFDQKALEDFEASFLHRQTLERQSEK